MATIDRFPQPTKVVMQMSVEQFFQYMGYHVCPDMLEGKNLHMYVTEKFRDGTGEHRYVLDLRRGWTSGWLEFHWEEDQ